MISTSKVCGYKGAGVPYHCVNNEITEMENCEQQCTDHEHCIAFSFGMSCMLFPTKKSCPSGWGLGKQGTGQVVSNPNQLEEGRASGQNCKAKTGVKKSLIVLAIK